MDYTDAIKTLTSQEKFRIELGLERISKILELLDNPQDNLKCIHVAGTNGKGSVCAIINSILVEAGIKTGLYTSPHIFEYTERIKINNIEISKNDFANYIDKVCTLAKDNDINLTEFEIITAVMFKYFADNNVEVVILETGLGGRYDATNIIKSNLCSIITHIDYDHTERLGTTLEEIAKEKAGIIKKDCPLITNEGYEIIKDTADKNDSLQIFVAPFIKDIEMSLKGIHQRENLALALSCIEYCFPLITQTTIEQGLNKIKHPFRFEYFEEKNLIIDAAHNPNGIDALVKNLEYYFPNQDKRVVFGCLKNKDYKNMINKLTNYELYYYHFDNPNSATIKELQEVHAGKEYTDKFTDNKLTVICGSFYMLKELLSKF